MFALINLSIKFTKVIVIGNKVAPENVVAVP